MTILRPEKTKVTHVGTVKETVTQVLSALALGVVAFFIAGLMYLIIESIWV